MPSAAKSGVRFLSVPLEQLPKRCRGATSRSTNSSPRLTACRSRSFSLYLGFKVGLAPTSGLDAAARTSTVRDGHDRDVVLRLSWHKAIFHRCRLVANDDLRREQQILVRSTQLEQRRDHSVVLCLDECSILSRERFRSLCRRGVVQAVNDYRIRDVDTALCRRPIGRSTVRYTATSAWRATESRKTSAEGISLTTAKLQQTTE